MKKSNSKVRALCLLSGGLDSQLAVCVLKDQGIEVHGIVFVSPFFDARPAEEAARQLEIPLHKVDFSKDIVQLLASPKHGFGACLNPCIDCHARMIARAGEYMLKEGFDFIGTGEVLDERPMSQTSRSLGIVSRDSSFGDYLLRPLSARLLGETETERRGLVKRDLLLALHGRSRKEQMLLAAKYKLAHVPTPAGGCLLTDPNFSKRLKDLIDNEGLEFIDRIELLKYGRHIRFSCKLKLVVGRNQNDNNEITRLARATDYLFSPVELMGPVALLNDTASEEELRRAASICARYSDADPVNQFVEIRICRDKTEKKLKVMPLEPLSAGLRFL